MTRRARALFAAALLIWCAACTREAPVPVGAPEHPPVVREALARLESELAAERPAPPKETVELDPEHLPGLVRLALSGRGRELARAEVRELGQSAVPGLAAMTARAELPAEERLAALDLLAASGTASAARHVARLLATAPEPWLRAHAAFRSGEMGRDELVPELALRLKYETDPEATIWIASALASFANYSGLDALWRLYQGGASEDVRAAAGERLATLAAEAGAEDALEHHALWHRGDPRGRLPRRAPSTRLRYEAWKRIQALSSEHFQLRGVDDARFVLASLGAWAAEPLAEALRDEDAHVRVHAAQCLERMGPRALSAGPGLALALDDPLVAHWAAAAIGAVGYAAGERELRARLAPKTPHELRVACAEALGRLALPGSLPALRELAHSKEPIDLRQAAATALVALGAGDEVAAELWRLARTDGADRFGAENALERWLAGRDDAFARETLADWQRHALPPGIIPTVAQNEERLALRLELLEAALPRLVPSATPR